MQFVGIQSVEKADAKRISEAISSLKRKVDGSSGSEELWKEKLVACGTDGAAVMMGAKSVAASRLRGDKSHNSLHGSPS